MSRPVTEISGFRELQEKLKRLANDKQRKAEVIKVLRAVASGTTRVAKNNAPKSKKPHLISGKRTRRVIQPGNLKKSIGVIVGKRGKAKENPTVYVGPRAKGNNLGFYGNFVEYGHNIYKAGFKRKRSASAKARQHNTAGSSKRTAANPFMAKTYAETKGHVTAETEQKVVAIIKKSINKYSTR